MQAVIIENLSHDGRGIARIEGKTTFIEGALKDEIVTIEYTRKKRDFDEARVVAVEKASPNRVTPRCPHYGICGGCSLQHMNEAAQIHEKESLMLDILKRIGHLEPEVIIPPLVSPKLWHYRNRARLSVNVVPKKNRVLVGFREKHKPRFVADITRCFILNEAVGERLEALSELIGGMDNPRAFPQIEVAAGDDVTALIFRHLEPLSAHDETRLRDFAKQYNFRIFLQPKGIDSITLFYPEGERSLHYMPDDALEIAFYPGDFTQVNAEMNRLMIEQAITLLKPALDDVIVDLFCGLGNFSLPFAKQAKQVIGVEGSDVMVQRALENAKANDIENVAFHAADLAEEDALSSLPSLSCNKLLLDPPRTGAEAIVSSIDSIAPDEILYISCNPATFARDASILVHQKHYRLVQAGVMDMFPHTTHVEVMGLFKRDV